MNRLWAKWLWLPTRRLGRAIADYKNRIPIIVFVPLLMILWDDLLGNITWEPYPELNICTFMAIFFLNMLAVDIVTRAADDIFT